MKMCYEVGDVVCLNSGSPNLTVTFIGTGPWGPDNVTVQWYDEDGRDQRADFPEACLKPVKTLSPFVEMLQTVDGPKAVNTSIVDLWKLQDKP